MHDRIAELRGLRTELATCLTGHRLSRRAVADQVREQIDRVRQLLETEAEAHESRAEALAGAGQEHAAANAATAARELRAVLDEDQADDDQAPPDPEPDPGPGGGFDPKGASVEEVRAHLADADQAEVERVLVLEAAGKKRKGVLADGEQLLAAARARTGSTAGPGGPATNTAAPAAPETRNGDA